MKRSVPRLFPTTLVGSYPQPDWLIDRKRLADIVPPRARARELWRVEAGTCSTQAQDDATHPRASAIRNAPASTS